MLKALELIGFKSFPDKTRFDFPPGITVVVGPNGSGKSNVVDAMKWVLGEQSARSLRGKEMADVIFKGSAQGKRKPANTAQVTIIFDNTGRLLPLDESEVHVTRRVYRSGEGEYLINGQACRLRDVRDLFRGTGVGTDSYSLIEQGKVDSLLQASPRDRRAIFEEAAGISRFKAKKVEAERRLERVEQNLLRLSDIVDEVETRLKRLRSQATKAQRYKEYSDRLQSLRTHVGRVDWLRLTQQLADIELQFATILDRVRVDKSDLEAIETQTALVEAELSKSEEALRVCEGNAGRAREQMAACRSVAEQQKLVLVDVETETQRSRQKLVAIHAKASDLVAQFNEIQRACAEAHGTCDTQRDELMQRRGRLAETNQQVSATRQVAEAHRAEFVEQMRVAADVGNRITALESQLSALQESFDAAQSSLQMLAQRRASADHELQACDHQAVTVRQHAESITQRVVELTRTTEVNSASIDHALRELAESRDRQTALTARASVLREIEARMEGVGSGVKQVLEAARRGDAPFVGVRGMVADIFRVTEPEKAGMIDVALGERTQHLVVAGQQLFDVLEREQHDFPGRVGFLRLQSTPPPSAAGWVNLTGQSGVIGRADSFVETSTEYQHLVSWLLRDTWFVESLGDAIQYHRSVSAPIRLVTRHGELLDRDGRLVVGPQDIGLGLISRRAELRTIEQQLIDLEQHIQRQSGELDGQRVQFTQCQQELNQTIQQKQEIVQQAATLELRLASAQERAQQCGIDEQGVRKDLESTDDKLRKTAEDLRQQRHELTKLETAIRGLEETLERDRAALQEFEKDLQLQQHDVTQWEVVFAKSEQRLDALSAQRKQAEQQQLESEEALRSAGEELIRNQRRHRETELHILDAHAQIAEMAIVEQQCQREAAEILETRDARKAEKATLGQQLVKLRSQIAAGEQQHHAIQIESERLKHQRTTLLSRLEEDYGVSVVQLESGLSADDTLARDDIDAEIDDLRRKISNLGAVNMDALGDLTDLESRFESLSTQYQDLVEAKESLLRIITKINADSRRLFTETLEAVRANFSVLFRKVFGGGKADIVLEEGVDILESGIDLVATPPGKHSLNLSLLSGGERALTAVALLLAIFQYRPSPFCVLDEVDGPLDEANIGRFIDVLREFLQWTKFVVVTHSKRTMTAAHTLYGVTMQESGVSKRVSVRFEDVGDDGSISDDAVRRSEAGLPAADTDDERGAA